MGKENVMERIHILTKVESLNSFLRILKKQHDLPRKSRVSTPREIEKKSSRASKSSPNLK